MFWLLSKNSAYNEPKTEAFLKFAESPTTKNLDTNQISHWKYNFENCLHKSIRQKNEF